MLDEHNSPQYDMILSTLSINFHGFTLGFPKRLHANGVSIPHF